MVGAGERRVDRLLVAPFAVGGDVVGNFVPNRRRAGPDRLGHIGDRGQRLVIDLDQLGRIPCLVERLRHHHGDAIADMAHLVPRQRVVGRDERQRAVSVDQRRFRRIERVDRVDELRHQAEPVGQVFRRR